MHTSYVIDRFVHFSVLDMMVKNFAKISKTVVKAERKEERRQGKIAMIVTVHGFTPYW